MAKIPKDKNWQVYCKDRATEAEVEKWEQEFPDHNVGLCMGFEVRPGWAIVGVDIDEPDYQEKVERAIGALVSGKRGAKGATWFALAPHGTKSRSIKMTKALGGKTLVDFLAVGKQTVIPPSIHPNSGEPYYWLGTPLTDFPVDLLPKVNDGLILELQAIATGKDQYFNGGVVGAEGLETEIDGINNMIWAGDGGGGTTHDARLGCIAHMVGTGWTEEDAVERLNRAMREAVERGAADQEPDWDRVHRDHEKMFRGAVDKGFGDKKEKAKSKANPPERTLADWAVQHYAPIVFTKGVFRKYVDGHWPEIRPELIKKAMLEISMAIKNSDVNNAIQVMATLLDDPDFGAKSVTKVCLQNGTIDVMTGKMEQHDPDHQCIHQMDFDWDGEALCPVYDKFIDWMFKGGEKEIAAWDEFAGLSLVPEHKYQKMMYLLGPGANGKSTLAYLVMSVHPDSAVSTVPITSLDDERHRTSLVGAYLNVSTEQSRLNTVADAVFKQIVGGDPVSIRLLFQEVQNKVVLPARLLCLANELPATNDSSFAMRRRMIILDCPNIISDEDKDPDLIDKLKAERPAILRRWIEAFRRLRERGKFDEPESSAQAVESYLRENDSVAQWMDMKTVPQPAADVATWPSLEDTYMEYQEYAKTMGYRNPYTMPIFKAKLKNLGVKISRTEFQVGNVISIVEQIGLRYVNASDHKMAARL